MYSCKWGSNNHGNDCGIILISREIKMHIHSHKLSPPPPHHCWVWTKYYMRTTVKKCVLTQQPDVAESSHYHRCTPCCSLAPQQDTAPSANYPSCMEVGMQHFKVYWACISNVVQKPSILWTMWTEQQIHICNVHGVCMEASTKLASFPGAREKRGRSAWDTLFTHAWAVPLHSP